MWSMPPADPPAQLTRSGSARKSSRRSARVWWGEPAGTATTSYSSRSRASGTASSIETGERLVRMDPSMTCPNTITVWGSPRWRATRSASPMVPPAPPRLTTSTGHPEDAGLGPHLLDLAGGLVPAAAGVGRARAGSAPPAETRPPSAPARRPAVRRARRRRTPRRPPRRGRRHSNRRGAVDGATGVPGRTPSRDPVARAHCIRTGGRPHPQFRPGNERHDARAASGVAASGTVQEPVRPGNGRHDARGAVGRRGQAATVPNLRPAGAGRPSPAPRTP